MIAIVLGTRPEIVKMNCDKGISYGGNLLLMSGIKTYKVPHTS